MIPSCSARYSSQAECALIVAGYLRRSSVRRGRNGHPTGRTLGLRGHMYLDDLKTTLAERLLLTDDDIDKFDRFRCVALGWRITCRWCLGLVCHQPKCTGAMRHHRPSQSLPLRV